MEICLPQKEEELVHSHFEMDRFVVAGGGQ